MPKGLLIGIIEHTPLSNRIELSVVWMQKISATSRKRVLTLNSTKSGPMGKTIARQLKFFEKTRTKGLP